MTETFPTWPRPTGCNCHRSRAGIRVTAANCPVHTEPTPFHQLPSSCHVCGRGQHGDSTPHNTTPQGHTFWSNEDALAEAKAYDARQRGVCSPEAAYVAEHRPY